MKKLFTIVFCLFTAFASAAVMEVTDANFSKEVENASQPVVVDVYATWCQPCKKMGPIFEAVSKEIPNVKFVKVDYDKTKDACARFNVKSLPTFLFIKDGKEVGREMGMMSQEAFANKVKQKLS